MGYNMYFCQIYEIDSFKQLPMNESKQIGKYICERVEIEFSAFS